MIVMAFVIVMAFKIRDRRAKECHPSGAARVRTQFVGELPVGVPLPRSQSSRSL